MIGIYKITNINTNMIYIGQSCDVWRRIREHQRADDINTLIDYSIKIEGVQNFNFEILEECSNEELNAREKYWIAFYDSYHSGYNNTPGGKGRPIISPEEESQIIDYYINSDYSISQISKVLHRSMPCVRNCLLRNNIAIRKSSYSNNDYYKDFQDLEEIKTIIFDLYDKGFSIKKIQKLTNKDHNRISTFLKQYGYEVNNQRNLRKRVVQIDLDSEEILATYQSLSEAASAVSGDKSGISKVCLGKRHQAYGYKWSYID